MKKAFVNCRIMPGGVLNVFVDMIESEDFSQAKIFTVFSDRPYLETNKGKIDIITALPNFLNRLFLFFAHKDIFILSSILDYRNLMFFYKGLMKVLTKKIIKYTPPKVVISSFAIAKNLEFCHHDYQKSKLFKKSNFNPITSLYLHSPMQYIRSHHKEYLNKLNGYKLKIFKIITPNLRIWDKQYTVFDKIYANSKYTTKLIKDIYDIDSEIKYPKIEEDFINSPVSLEPQNYYIYVGRLVKFVKELDKIIKLFNETSESLLIMGDGPDKEYLKFISNGNIIFIGRIEDPLEKIKIIKNSIGLINITKESFGLGTVESLLLGVPVFAYDDGASPELIDGDSGILVPNKKQETLVKYFDKFKHVNRDRNLIKQNIKVKINLI